MTTDLTRQVVLARAYWRCECCGDAAATDVHHRQPRGMGGVHGAAAAVSNSPPNLLAVCRPCHDRCDDQPVIARLSGWLVPHPTDPATVPALLHTVNGFGWWVLREDGGYDFPREDAKEA